MAETSQALLLRATTFITRHYLKDCGDQILWPLRTAELLATVGGESENTRLLVAALIHDVCANNTVNEQQVELAFGTETWALVLEVLGYEGNDTSDESIDEEREDAVKSSVDAQKLKIALLIAGIERIMYDMPETADKDGMNKAIEQAERLVEAIEDSNASLAHYFYTATCRARRDGGAIKRMKESPKEEEEKRTEEATQQLPC